MKILLFGITREITGQSVINLPTDAAVSTVRELKEWMGRQYPAMQALSSMAVAVNHEYAEDDEVLSLNQEIALIPPVSGG